MWEKKQIAHSPNSMLNYPNHSNSLCCLPVVGELGGKTVQARRVLLHLLLFPFSGGTWRPWPWPTHPQTSVNVGYSQPLFWPSNKFSTGVKPPNPHPQPFLHSKAWYWHLFFFFFLWEIVNSILFGITALISPLKYHINSELPWVDEFTVLVNLFCWKSQIWFRNNSVHCDGNKQTKKKSSLITSINKRDFCH